MFPQIQQGTFTIASSSFSSASWVKFDIGMIPDRLELRIYAASAVKPSAATIIGAKVDFNQASSSVVNDLWLIKAQKTSSTENVWEEFVASSSSNAFAILNENSHSSSSSALTSSGKRGFKIAQALCAGNLKGKKLHYIAFNKNGAFYSDLGTVSDSDA